MDTNFIKVIENLKINKTKWCVFKGNLLRVRIYGYVDAERIRIVTNGGRHKTILINCLRDTKEEAYKELITFQE